MSPLRKSDDRFFLQRSTRKKDLRFDHCLKHLRQTSCKDKTCAVHTGEGLLCPRHTRTIRNYWLKELAHARSWHGIRSPSREYSGPSNSLCLSCFAVNRHCHCPDQEKCVISIGYRFRVPRRTALKKVWQKELAKFKWLVDGDYPKDQIGCRYVPSTKKVKA